MKRSEYQHVIIDSDEIDRWVASTLARHDWDCPEEEQYIYEATEAALAEWYGDILSEAIGERYQNASIHVMPSHVSLETWGTFNVDYDYVRDMPSRFWFLLADTRLSDIPDEYLAKHGLTDTPERLALFLDRCSTNQGRRLAKVLRKHPESITLVRGVLAGDTPEGILADWLEENTTEGELIIELRKE